MHAGSLNMDANDGELGEVGLLLVLGAVGSIPIVGAWLDPGWSQGEVGMGVLIAGFACFQLVGAVWRRWRRSRVQPHADDHASRSRNL